MKFVNIEYDKEYVELIQAFIPNYKDKDFIVGKAGDKLVLITDTSKFQVDIDYSQFASIKPTIKLHLYKLLNKYTNKELSWGILVGVTPLKLFEKLQIKYGENRARQILEQKYLVSRKKIDLAFEILDIQKLYKDNYKDMYSLYINIPFCPSKCSYCSYPTYPADNESIKSYIFSLKKEIIEISKHLSSDLASIYIGGGSPSAIGEDNLIDFISFMKTFINEAEEFTVELGRVDCISEDLLKRLYKLGVNRISINPQTFNKESLRRIGRNTDIDDIIKYYSLAKEIGFKEINMDLIMGIDDLESFKNSLENIKDLETDNLTIHGLAYKKASSLEQTDYIQTDAYEEVRDKFIERSSYKPYYLYRQKNIYKNGENIGYFINSPCIYNICMMGDVHSVIGLGLAGSTKILKNDKIYRHMNYRTLNDYNNLVDIDIDKKIEMLRKD